jgi:hypothetical protein
MAVTANDAETGDGGMPSNRARSHACMHALKTTTSWQGQDVVALRNNGSAPELL